MLKWILAAVLMFPMVAEAGGKSPRHGPTRQGSTVEADAEVDVDVAVQDNSRSDLKRPGQYLAVPQGGSGGGFSTPDLGAAAAAESTTVRLQRVLMALQGQPDREADRKSVLDAMVRTGLVRTGSFYTGKCASETRHVLKYVCWPGWSNIPLLGNF